MRSYPDVCRVLSAFVLIISYSAQESVWCGGKRTDHGPDNIPIKRKNEGWCTHERSQLPTIKSCNSLKLGVAG